MVKDVDYGGRRAADLPSNNVDVRPGPLFLLGESRQLSYLSLVWRYCWLCHLRSRKEYGIQDRA